MGTSRPGNFLLRRMSPSLVLVFSLSLLDTISSHPQVSFGGSSGNSKPAGNDKNLDIADISTRWGEGSSGGYQPGQCCCIRQFQSCLSQLTGTDDLVGEGLIDQRIVNRPGSGSGSGNSGPTSCPSGEKLCCSSDLVRSQCSGQSSGLTSGGHSGGGSWRQGCTESQVFGQNKCGERSYSRPASGIGHGESSPGEFPWTCLILNSDNSRGTAKVLTAAHNLNNVGSARSL